VNGRSPRLIIFGHTPNNKDGSSGKVFNVSMWVELLGRKPLRQRESTRREKADLTM